jgi:hypothetical protein
MTARARNLLAVVGGVAAVVVLLLHFKERDPLQRESGALLEPSLGK